MTHKIITWTQLTSVINFGMCTDITTWCLSTSGGGPFSFRDEELSLLVRILFTKHLLKRKRWNPWIIMSLGVWFPWKIWPNKFWPLRSSIFSTWTPRHKEEGWFCTNYYYFITNIKIKETTGEEAEDVYVTVYLNFKGCIKEGIGNEGD